MGQAGPDSSTTAEDFACHLGSFERSLGAENKAPATIVSYLNAVRKLQAFLAESGMPQLVTDVRLEHIEAYLVAMEDRGAKPTTRAHAYRSLQQFWKWLADEHEIDESPVRNMKPPHIPEEPVAVVSKTDIDALLKTCDGRDFDDRRDTAILMLFLDTGMRLSDLAGLKVEDIDFTDNVAIVLGKGRRHRAAPFGKKVGSALDAYLKRKGARRDHRLADSEWLWLGKRGVLLSLDEPRRLGVLPTPAPSSAGQREAE